MLDQVNLKKPKASKIGIFAHSLTLSRRVLNFLGRIKRVDVSLLSRKQIKLLCNGLKLSTINFSLGATLGESSQVSHREAISCGVFICPPLTNNETNPRLDHAHLVYKDLPSHQQAS